MKTSLVTKLELLAKGYYPNLVNGGEFERLAMSEGMKASNASRRCREMVEAGILERIPGKSVSYRWIPPESRKVEPKESPPVIPKKFWQRVNQETRQVKFIEPFKKVETTNKLFS